MERLLLLCLLAPTSIWATSIAASLYFTNFSSIQLLDNNLTTVVLGELEHAESCDICGQTVFWVDMLGKIKKGVLNNQSSIEVVIDKDLRHPVGLAVDCKGSNVYFSDTRNVEGQGRIEVTSYNGRQRKVLLHNLCCPGPLVLNMVTGHLYFVDEFDIKRISADGDGDQQEVYFDYNGIKGLAVDVINNLLYWTVGSDIKYLNITHWETLTQTQQNNIVPETVSKGFDGAVPYSISVINSTIYWTEDREVNQENLKITRPGAIYSTSLPTNTAQRLLQDNTLSPQDVCTFVNISVHHGGCAVNNRNCQHFCFTVPDGNGGTRPQCGCPTGIMLHADNKTCPEIPSEFLVFTQQFHNHSEIRQISLDIPGRYIDTLVPIDNLGSGVSFLSYDLMFHQIYWTEVHPPAIKRAHINGSNVETFIETGLKHPKGIAVDSYSRSLYWVDSALNRIEVARLSDSKNRRVLFSSHLDHPTGLALDLHHKYMYWTDLDISGTKIERARMDGTGRMNLPNITYTIKTPTNIAVDPLTSWVYWSETDSEVERVSRYDGSHDFSLSLSDTGDVFGLTIHGDYIYWTDRFLSSRALVRAQKSSGDGEEVILENYAGLSGLVAVNSTTDIAPTSCGCEQLCLPSGTSTTTCSCRDNYIIDGNHCEDPAPHVYISSKTVVAPFKETSGHWSRSQQIGIPYFNITASAIDIDYREFMLYWISSVDKLIYRQYVNLTSTSEPEALVTCCLVAPEDLAVDWLGRNLYWTDSNRRVIEVAKLDGGGRTILAQFPESLGSPSFIALDPTRGYLYWVQKSQAKIYKMRMDGSSPPELFWSADLPKAEEKVIGIAINYEETPNDVIYWGTQTTDTTGALWRKELTVPQTAQTIIVLNQKPLHVATFKYNLYFHFQSRIFGDLINSFNIQQLSNNLVLSRGSRGRDFQDFTDFVIVHHSLQPGIHECSVLNHGCDETLCLISNKLDGMCPCPASMIKQVEWDLISGQYRSTCTSTNSLLLIATQEAIHYLPVPLGAHPKMSRPQPLPVGPLYDVSAVAYDPVNKTVLWFDRETQFLHRATVDGRQFWNITKIANASVLSIAYDWLGGQVFLTKELGFQMELVTANGEGGNSLLFHDVQQTSLGDVVFDVGDSVLYWTTLSQSGRGIGYMSLENTSAIYCLNVSGRRMIDKLTFEPSRKSLYWVNTMNATIERYDIQTGQLSIVAAYATNVSALAAMPVNNQPYLFWYNTSDHSIYVSNGQHRNHSVYQRWTAPGAIVSFVGSMRSPPSPRPCSHLCIQQPGNPAYTCACPFNHQLNPNGRCSGPLKQLYSLPTCISEATSPTLLPNPAAVESSNRLPASTLLPTQQHSDDMPTSLPVSIIFIISTVTPLTLLLLILVCTILLILITRWLITRKRVNAIGSTELGVSDKGEQFELSTNATLIATTANAAIRTPGDGESMTTRVLRRPVPSITESLKSRPVPSTTGSLKSRLVPSTTGSLKSRPVPSITGSLESKLVPSTTGE